MEDRRAVVARYVAYHDHFTVVDVGEQYVGVAGALAGRGWSKHAAFAPPAEVASEGAVRAAIRQHFSERSCRADVQQLSLVAVDHESGRVVGVALVEPHGFRDGRSGALCCSGDDDAPAAFLRHQDDVAAVLHRANSAYFGAKGAHGPEAVARLHLVAVEPAFWGQGIGSRLVEGAVAKARSGGYRALLSEMAGTASLRVAEKLGFREAARTKVPWSSEDCVLFIKELF